MSQGKMGIPRLLLLLAIAAGLTGPASAASLRVAPVMLDIPPGDAASTFKVWNGGDRKITVQVRVFRWRQAEGRDVLDPTEDVVVSPPMTTLMPGEETLVRAIRVSKSPVEGEECYRVLVDELPDPTRGRAGAVALLLRHSIPLFFHGGDDGGPQVSWRVTREAGALLVTATNTGARRMRIADLAISQGRRELSRQQGLAGYVLAGASTSWVVPSRSADAEGLTISARSEAGPIHAAAGLSSR